MSLLVILSDLFVGRAFYGQDQEEQQAGGHIRHWDRVGKSGTHGISQATHSVMKTGCQVAHVTGVCRILRLPQKKKRITPVPHHISDCIRFSLDDLMIIVWGYTCKMTELGLPLGSLLPHVSFYTRINLEVKWLVHGHKGKKWHIWSSALVSTFDLLYFPLHHTISYSCWTLNISATVTQIFCSFLDFSPLGYT